NRILWKLFDPAGRELFFDRLDGNSPGVVTLTNGVPYIVKVFPEAQFSGTYSFKILDVPPPNQFAINIGDTISNGVPGPGAGNIESAGVDDDYTFTAQPGHRIFPYATLFRSNRILWKLFDPAGRELFFDRLD